MRLGLALLALWLTACSVLIEPEGLSVTYRLGYGGAILRFQPDRGPGATYYVGEEIRFFITLARPGYVTLVVTDPDGYTYELDRAYLEAGALSLPRGGYRYTLVPPRGLHRVRAVYTEGGWGSVTLQGVYRDLEGRLRVYLESSGSRVYDVAETHFYLR